MSSHKLVRPHPGGTPGGVRALFGFDPALNRVWLVVELLSADMVTDLETLFSNLNLPHPNLFYVRDMYTALEGFGFHVPQEARQTISHEMLYGKADRSAVR